MPGDGIKGLFLCAALGAMSLIAQSPPEQAAPVQVSRAEGATLRVSGRVVDDVTGKPIAGANVELQVEVIHVTCLGCRSPEPRPDPVPLRQVTTGADGEFAFDDVSAVTTSLRATKPGYTDVWPSRRDAEDHLGTYQAEDLRSPILLRLAPQASISGVVRNAAGASIGRTGLVTLWVLKSWEGWPTLDYGGWPTFDPDGTYHFDGLVPGRYYLLAGLDPVRQGPTRFEDGHGVGEVPVRFPAPTDDDPNPFLVLHEGEQAHVDFRLAETALHRVTLTGSPQSPVGLSFVDENRSGYMVREAEIGKLSEAWLPNGGYSLENGRAGEIDGPMPVEVEDSGVSDLHFTIVPSDPKRLVGLSVQITSTQVP